VFPGVTTTVDPKGVERDSKREGRYGGYIMTKLSQGGRERGRK